MSNVSTLLRVLLLCVPYHMSKYGDPAFQDVGQRIALMDEADITVQILSFGSANIWHPDPARRAGVVQVFNDSMFEAIKPYPDRFRLFANLPLPHVDRAIAEAERTLALGAVGFGVCTQFAGLPIDDRCFEPLYAYLNMRKAVVMFHPDGFVAPGILEDFVMEWALGAPFEDSIVLVRLIYLGLPSRFPDITWIVPHCGGTIPFLAEQLDYIWRFNPALQELLPQPPSVFLRSANLYVDTINPQASALALAREVFGADHMLFGTDFPFANRHDLAGALHVLPEAGFSDSEMQVVLGGNICATCRYYRVTDLDPFRL